MRVVIAEDTVLLREGLAGLLEDAGHEVVGRAGDAEALLALVGEHAPELAVVDVRMPPDYEDEGTRAAAVIRAKHPGTAVLVLSQHIETRHVVELEASGDRAPPEVEAVAYFIACEALTNAVKHGSPSRVTVQTERSDDVLRLVVADDGVGGAAPASGRGLAGMADRVAAQGGTLALESPPGAGTRIAVELPCAS